MNFKKLFSEGSVFVVGICAASLVACHPVIKSALVPGGGVKPQEDSSQCGPGVECHGDMVDKTDYGICEKPTTVQPYLERTWIHRRNNKTSGRTTTTNLKINLSTVAAEAVCEQDGHPLIVQASTAVSVTGNSIVFRSHDDQQSETDVHGKTLHCESHIAAGTFKYAYTSGGCLVLTGPKSSTKYIPE